MSELLLDEAALFSVPGTTATFAARVLLKVDVGHPLGCWDWMGGCDSHGYGVAHAGGKRGRKIPAHTAVWWLLCGPPLTSLTPDHRCRRPRCVNPDHIEWVTFAENILRGEGTSARWARRTRCERDPVHALDGLTRDTRTGRMYRYCKACERARSAARYTAGTIGRGRRRKNTGDLVAVALAAAAVSLAVPHPRPPGSDRRARPSQRTRREPRPRHSKRGSPVNATPDQSDDPLAVAGDVAAAQDRHARALAELAAADPTARVAIPYALRLLGGYGRRATDTLGSVPR